MNCLVQRTEYPIQESNRGVAMMTFADGTVSVFQKFAQFDQGKNISFNG